jgi:ferrous iron transport protein A
MIPLQIIFDIRAGHKQTCMKLRLSELGVGKSGVIDSFEKDNIFLKLMEMGCVPGEIVKVDQVAPLGDPISISVAGYHLSLRLDEAEMIWVNELILS